MVINISTSESNKQIVTELSQKFLHTKEENIIPRIALGYSLQRGRKFSENDFGIYDSKGKSYKDQTLFNPKYKNLFILMICQYYGINKNNENISKYIKLHIDDGLEALYNLVQSDEKYTLMDFLKDHLDKGISFLESNEINLDHVKNNNQNIEKDYFTAEIKLLIGKDKEDEIYLSLNSSEYNNQHIAVAGSSGTGKTQFALHLLKEITTVSNQAVNFIYLDFKGLKGEDLEYYKPFFDSTNTNFIDVPNTKFPLNPLSFTDNINEVNKQMGIDKFTDIICKYSNLGVKQKGLLRQAITESFYEKKSGNYPTIQEITDRLLELMGDKRDSLSEIMEDLSRYGVFGEADRNQKPFISENIYLSLSGDLSNSLRFTSLFLIINYIYNTFMNMENTPVDEQGYRAIRYIVLIDEAHVIFKEKKYQDILDKMLREIRSKGVAIILLSQGIEEFNQPNFDFSSNCEISFLLDIKDKNNTRSINKFLGLSEKEGVKVARSLEKIQKGQAISNIKEFEKGKLFELMQFKDKK
jgi:DNA sulfur modification protein DndE